MMHHDMFAYMQKSMEVTLAQVRRVYECHERHDIAARGQEIRGHGTRSTTVPVIHPGCDEWEVMLAQYPKYRGMFIHYDEIRLMHGCELGC